MYIELHARSAFSFLEGSSLPEDLIAICAARQQPAMALLDRDGLYGAPRFHMAAKSAGLHAHIGAEVACEDLGQSSPQRHRDTEETEKQEKEKFSKEAEESAFPLRKSSPRSGNQHNLQSTISNLRSPNSSVPLCLCGEKVFRLSLLAASRTGYQNLCQLLTRMKLRAKKDEGAVFAHELEHHASGLICLTGGDEGPLAAALARGGYDEAVHSVERLTQIFGRENVYVELQRHFHRDEEFRNRAALDIAHALHLPILATNGVCYATPKDRELCDVLTAIRHHETLMTAGRLLARNSERHLKTAEEMSALFADLPEAIANTRELSSRLEFTLKDLGYEFPRYPVPEGETMNSFLRQRTDEGARRRYGISLSGDPVPLSGPHNKDLQQRARRQLNRELALIEKLELAGYFLIVWDLVRFCREQNILAQGRGSAANSAVCYALGITAVDPIAMELLFERFLSEERGEWPDIDIDLPSGDQRERVIQYVYQRYGERGAAMTANVITYRNRMAAREMGKAMGFDLESLNKISAAVGTWEFKDENDSLDRRLNDAGLDLRHPRLRKYFELCLAVQDLPRHLGQHSGGMVICQGQLDSVVPLEPASMPGRVVVQWDKEDCADMGIIKVDLLGLGMMAVLEDTIELIRRDYQEEVDLAHLPADDPAVYSALQQADTIGLFQIESRAQMSCLPRLRPERFYDIVVQVAIIRPGPIVGQMVNPFLQRRQGREPVTYPHPSLEPVLKRTLGVPLFQEQLLRIAMISANFSGGEAEELRRAMGFKRSQARMKEIEARLRSGMTANGIAPEAQEQIILSITSFALYGFPESHAASFALIAYASAWLKCHYLAAFTAGLLNNQPMGFYHPATLVKDAQRHGLKVLPVDVTKSDWKCRLEPVVSRRPVVGRESVVSRWSLVVGEEAVASCQRPVAGDPSAVSSQLSALSSPHCSADPKTTPATQVTSTMERGASSPVQHESKPRFILENRFIAGPGAPEDRFGSGHGLSRADNAHTSEGLSPCATILNTASSIEIPWDELGAYTRPPIPKILDTVTEIPKNNAPNNAINNNLCHSERSEEPAVPSQEPSAHSQEPSAHSEANPAISTLKSPHSSDSHNHFPAERSPALLATPVLGTRQFAVRLGLNYVRGLREAAAQALVRERSLRPFDSIHDLARRVPELRKDELTTLAEIGALNSIGKSSPQRHRDTEKILGKDLAAACHSAQPNHAPEINPSMWVPARGEVEGCLSGESLMNASSSIHACHSDPAHREGEEPAFPLPSSPSIQACHSERSEEPAFHAGKTTSLGTRYLVPGTGFHRRDALWQVERAVRASGPLLDNLPEPDSSSPLQPMTHEERLIADFHGTGLTTGPHAMAYRRPEMKALGIRSAAELKSMRSGQRLRIGGCVITRQRPGTAKGFLFLSLEDETGVANAIVRPDLLQQNRLLLTAEPFLMVEGILQNQDNVISVKAERVLPLFVTRAETKSHDFH